MYIFLVSTVMLFWIYPFICLYDTYIYHIRFPNTGCIFTCTWMFLVLKSLSHLFLSKWVPAHIPQLGKGTHFVNVFLEIHASGWNFRMHVSIWQNCISDRSNSVAVFADTDRYTCINVYWKDDPRFSWNTLENFNPFFTFPQVGQAKAMSKIKAWSRHIICHFWYCSSVCKMSSTTFDEEPLEIMKEH